MTHKFETDKSEIYDAYMDAEELADTTEPEVQSTPEPAPAKKSPSRNQSAETTALYNPEAKQQKVHDVLEAWGEIDGEVYVEPKVSVSTVNHEITDGVCLCGESVEPLLPVDREKKLSKVERMLADKNDTYTIRFALYNTFDACLSVHSIAQFFVDAGLNFRNRNKPMSFEDVLDDAQRLADKSTRKRGHSGHYGCNGPAAQSLLSVGVNSADNGHTPPAAKSNATKKGQRRAYATQRVFAGLDTLKIAETLLGHRSAESIGVRCVNAFNIMLKVFGPHMTEGRWNVEIFNAYVADSLEITETQVHDALKVLRQKKVIFLKKRPMKSGEASVYNVNPDFQDELLSNLLKAIAKEYGVAQDEKITLAYNYLSGAVQVVDYSTKSKAVYGDVYRNCKWRAETFLARFGHYVGLEAERQEVLDAADKRETCDYQYVAIVRGVEVEVERETPQAADFLEELARVKKISETPIHELPSYSVDNPEAYLDDLDFDTPVFEDAEIEAAYAETTKQDAMDEEVESVNTVDTAISTEGYSQTGGTDTLVRTAEKDLRLTDSARRVENAESLQNNYSIGDNANMNIQKNYTKSNQQVNRYGNI